MSHSGEKHDRKTEPEEGTGSAGGGVQFKGMVRIDFTAKTV